MPKLGKQGKRQQDGKGKRMRCKNNTRAKNLGFLSGEWLEIS
jgi:hypothetical protein